MKNVNSVAVILTYLIGAVLLWTVAFPIYSGGGASFFSFTPTLQLIYENEKLSEAYESADSLSKRAGTQYEQYKNIPQEYKDKLGLIVKNKLDMPRVYNDIATLASAANMNIENPSIVVAPTKNYPDLDIKSLSLIAPSNYQAFRNFLFNIENNLSFYNVSGISFKENKDPLKNWTDYSITIDNFTLK